MGFKNIEFKEHEFSSSFPHDSLDPKDIFSFTRRAGR